MTNFSPHPERHDLHFMRTRFPAEVKDTLQTLHAVENISPVEGLRRAIGLHKYQATLRAAGGLLLVQTPEGIEPFAPPAHDQYEATDKPAVPAQGYVGNAFKEYVEPMTNPDDADDLLGFWHAAVSFYGAGHTHQALESSFWALKPHQARVRLGSVDFTDFYI